MARRAGAEAKGGRSIVKRLTPREAQAVLAQLLARHPELVGEAEGIARAMMSKVSFEEVADDVEAALRFPGLDELNDRAGPSRWGYTSPDEAAWDLLEEALQPFVDEMRRYAELGLEKPALEMCRGILMGLYRLRDGEGPSDDGRSVLAWAPDFPLEAAPMVVKAWRQARRPKGTAEKARAEGLARLQAFVAEHLPEWRGRIGA